MKIVYLSSSIIPSTKANSIQVMNMCDAFAELNNSVILFARTSESKLNIKEYYGIKNNFSIYQIKASFTRLLGGLEYGYKVCKKIKELAINPDIFYGRNLYALIACLKFNKPIIYESHNAPITGRKSLENYLFSKPQFKRLVVINKALFDYYKNNFKIFKEYPDKILIAHDGANINNIDLKSNKKTVIGYAGSLYPGKGIEKIVELAKTMPNCEFIVAGGSEEQIKKINNLTFLGKLYPSKIPEFLSHCDILLAPYSNKVYSDYDKKIDLSKWMSPLKIFEYMASKRPIIASDLPSIREILDNNRNAILVDLNAGLIEWKNSILRLIEKPELSKQLADNAFNLLKREYTWNIRATKVLEGIQHQKYTNNSSPKPIILHIIGDLNVGGAERNMLKILPQLNQKSYCHQILTLFELGRLAKDFSQKGIKVETLGISRNITGLINSKILLKLIKKIKTINPAIIQTWLYHSNNIINLISPFFKNVSIINCIRHDSPNIGSIKTKISAKLGAYISKLFNPTIIYCSKSSLEKHILEGYPNKNSYVIPNGFDIPTIDKKQEKFKLRKMFGIPEVYKIAINVGRYCEEKDYTTLFNAVKLVTACFDKIIFILCGKGLEKTNKELIKQIRNLNIENNVLLLGHQKNVENFIAGADFLVSSSSSESFPNVIAESMSLSIPCIATDVGETSNIIGNTGLVVPSKNTEELSKAILNYAYLDGNSLKELGEKACERIKEKYNLGKCLSMFEEVYEVASS